jgi:hypothetical protein
MEKILEYSNFHLDRLLDKVSKKGLASLTGMEKDFLNTYSQQDINQIEKELDQRENRYADLLEYDPRTETDTLVWDEINNIFGTEINFNEWTDEELEDGRFNILWDDMSEADIIQFLDEYNLPSNIIQSPWEQLDDETQANFKTYCQRFRTT